MPTQILNKLYSLLVGKNKMHRISYSQLIRVGREKDSGENLSPSKMDNQFPMVLSGTSPVPQVHRQY